MVENFSMCFKFNPYVGKCFLLLDEDITIRFQPNFDPTGRIEL